MKKKSIILIICLIVVPIFSSIRDTSNWVKVKEANKNTIINFRLGLRQKNLDILESTLLDVSNPKSINYGKWWSSDEIMDLIEPSVDDIKIVISYLLENGCFNIENHRDMVKASANVDDIEKMFNVKMATFSHKVKNQFIVRSSESYSVPREIKSLVHIVTGVSELPHYNTGPKSHKININERQESIEKGADPGLIIPYTLQKLYGIPIGMGNDSASSVCVVEFEDYASFNKEDLFEFAAATATPHINVDHIIGPFEPYAPGGEATLDVQYAGSISEGASVWFWTVDGWMFEFATDFFNTPVIPDVVSMSYGWPEPGQCDRFIAHCVDEDAEQYVQRVNIEFQKIGLRGTTLLAASGDQGAPGDSNMDCKSHKHPLSTSFPGASPWVTSVGATMLAEKPSTDSEDPYQYSAPICNKKKCATSTEELVCTYPQSLITTGGGFSNYSPMPSYQQKAVNDYFNSGVKFPNSTFFNSSNRAFPDISALGHNYFILAAGADQVIDGTSCSSPVLAGIISLLNGYRISVGKPPLGFINPLLYQLYEDNPAAYNDIEKGNNYCTEHCCAETGFESAKGYDAVTGLGTPVYQEFLNYIQTLN
ncbi:hypothetical protein CYY_001113 [Polysphondylium violaceum]|uniref:Peptidase S53 domain-containing protein n=1 Tax=Polysphondylium violaceum TaxID=133409 RepID=A0A8J4Q2I7_9MYCE|nr:hypothetical protein CYY_001113 [Polysphondylium violaceum]